jgi:hypothetical protein
LRSHPPRCRIGCAAILPAVIAGLDPAIHEAAPQLPLEALCVLIFIMDARVKPAHDSDGCAVILHAAELVARPPSPLSLPGLTRQSMRRRGNCH